MGLNPSGEYLVAKDIARRQVNDGLEPGVKFVRLDARVELVDELKACERSFDHLEVCKLGAVSPTRLR